MVVTAAVAVAAKASSLNTALKFNVQTTLNSPPVIDWFRIAGESFNKYTRSVEWRLNGTTEEALKELKK